MNIRPGRTSEGKEKEKKEEKEEKEEKERERQADQAGEDQQTRRRGEGVVGSTIRVGKFTSEEKGR